MALLALLHPVLGCPELLQGPSGAIMACGDRSGVVWLAAGPHRAALLAHRGSVASILVTGMPLCVLTAKVDQQAGEIWTCGRDGHVARHRY